MRVGKFSGFAINSFSLAQYLLIGVVLVILAIIFLGVPLFVSGSSMEPNFQSKEIVLVQRLSYSNHKPIRRGDVVAAKFPADSKHTRLIKRVIGLPGETVQVRDGIITINDRVLEEPYQINLGEPPYPVAALTQLHENQYFLVGDNRPGSSDSRLWGPVELNDIQGQVSFVLWPISKIRYVLRVDYN